MRRRPARSRPSASSPPTLRWSSVAASRLAESSGSSAASGAPALDATARLQPRDGRDERRAREVEGGRERRAGVVVRRLLGHGRRAPRAAHDDAPRGPRRPTELPLENGAVRAFTARAPSAACAACRALRQALDALDDVQLLVGPDETEPARLAHERRAALVEREPALQVAALVLQPPNLGLPLGRASSRCACTPARVGSRETPSARCPAISRMPDAASDADPAAPTSALLPSHGSPVRA